MRHVIQITTSTVLLAVMGIAGCGSGGVAEQAVPIEITGPPPGLANDGPHAHGETGPHGGHLIELGHNHKYHAELLENHDAQSVTVYILDKQMKELAINETSVVLNLTANGETVAYELVAVGDGHNTLHSRFESTDEALLQTLEQHGDVDGKLRVTIEGVPYVGRIAHHAHAHHPSAQRH